MNLPIGNKLMSPILSTRNDDNTSNDDITDKRHLTDGKTHSYFVKIQLPFNFILTLNKRKQPCIERSLITV